MICLLALPGSALASGRTYPQRIGDREESLPPEIAFHLAMVPPEKVYFLICSASQWKFFQWFSCL